jgi:transposase InsO family protein
MLWFSFQQFLAISSELLLKRIPAQIVSDNGSQFSSDEFATFMKRNGIKHFKSAPHHPATNGLAEQFIQTFKNSMHAMKDENRDIRHYLCWYSIT